MIPVNSVQFRRTVRLFNNQTFLKCNMNQSFFSDITICQCCITNFHTCFPIVLLYLLSFLCFVIPPQQLRIQIIDLAFVIRFPFIHFYGSIIFGYILVKLIWAGISKGYPGPRPSSSQNFSICHWNLNIISTYSYVKISLLRTYLSVHIYLFVRDIPRPQCSFTRCQFGNTGLWISQIRPHIATLKGWCMYLF